MYIKPSTLIEVFFPRSELPILYSHEASFVNVFY